MASVPPPSVAPQQKVWIPVELKIEWFSCLGVQDLARCARVCKSWSSLITKTADVMFVKAVGALPPPLSLAAKLRLIHRLQNPLEKENMGYLLAWAAGSREYLPFLHKLLLLRDAVREDLGLPGGLHEAARPDAYDELDDATRALWTYRLGNPPAPGTPAAANAPPVNSPAYASWLASQGVIDYCPNGPPLVVAAQRGNVDALHLLLLFGEGVHARRKGNERALYAACEQGNLACVAALLGRVPLRPPSHPPHIAERLGLLRPVWPVYAPGMVYSSGVAIGQLRVPYTIASTRIRAEFASATGLATTAGPRASAVAAAALTGGTGAAATSTRSAVAGVAGTGTAARGGVIDEDGPLTTVEALVSIQEQYESDGRYRAWCNGYHMGTYWHLYDTSLANYEALRGPIGAEAVAGLPGMPAIAYPEPLLGPPGKSGRHPKGPVPLVKRFCSHLTLTNLTQRLGMRIAPGSARVGTPLATLMAGQGVTPAYAAQALLVSRLPPTMPFAAASSMRSRGIVHPALPDPIDYGSIAAHAVAVKVRVNVGPIDGRTPLLAACERGRVEAAFLLLAHHDYALAASAETPQLMRRDEDDDDALPPPPPGGGAGGGGAAPAAPAAGGAGGGAGAAPPAGAAAGAAAAAPGGAAAAAAPAAPAAPTVTPAQAHARAALANIAMASPMALAVPPELAALSSRSRAEEELSTLLEEERDRADVDMAPEGYNTPLVTACERGDERLVALLLHWGADVNKLGRKEVAPLLAAATAGHHHVIRMLLRTTSGLEAARAVVAATEDFLRARDIEALTSAGAKARAVVETALRAYEAEVADTVLFPRPPWRPTIQAANVWPLDAELMETLANAGKAAGVFDTDAGSGVVDGAGPGLPSPSGPGGAGISAAQRAVLELLGLRGAEPAAIMRAVAGKAAGGSKGEGGGGGIIASQTGRRKGRGDARRPEDLVVDSCEPTVVAVLQAIAAAAAAAAGDDYGFGSTASLSATAGGGGGSGGLSAAMYLPPEEAAMTAAFASIGSSVSIESLYRMSGGAGGSRLRVGGAGTSSLAATLAAHRSGGAARGGVAAPAEVDSTLSAVEEFQTSPSGQSYARRLAEADGLRLLAAATIHHILTKSRIVTGIGQIDGRPTININVGDESGYTALFVAASSGGVESAVVLLAAGGDATIASKRGKTPIYGAVEKCNVELVELLLPKYTAHQLRANTTYGTNVMHAANRSGNNRIKDMLEKYCVDWDARETRRIKAERNAQKWAADPASKPVSKEDAARRQEIQVKRMMGMSAAEIQAEADNSEDPEARNVAQMMLASDAQVTATIDRLRRLAEAARKKQSEQDARRKDKTTRLSATYGGAGGPASAAASDAEDDSDDAEQVMAAADAIVARRLGKQTRSASQPRGRAASAGPRGGSGSAAAAASGSSGSGSGVGPEGVSLAVAGLGGGSSARAPSERPPTGPRGRSNAPKGGNPTRAAAAAASSQAKTLSLGTASIGLGGGDGEGGSGGLSVTASSTTIARGRAESQVAAARAAAAAATGGASKAAFTPGPGGSRGAFLVAEDEGAFDSKEGEASGPPAPPASLIPGRPTSLNKNTATLRRGSSLPRLASAVAAPSASSTAPPTPGGAYEGKEADVAEPARLSVSPLHASHETSGGGGGKAVKAGGAGSDVPFYERLAARAKETEAKRIAQEQAMLATLQAQQAAFKARSAPGVAGRGRSAAPPGGGEGKDADASEGGAAPAAVPRDVTSAGTVTSTGSGSGTHAARQLRAAAAAANASAAAAVAVAAKVARESKEADFLDDAPPPPPALNTSPARVPPGGAAAAAARTSPKRLPALEAAAPASRPDSTGDNSAPAGPGRDAMRSQRAAYFDKLFKPGGGGGESGAAPAPAPAPAPAQSGGRFSPLQPVPPAAAALSSSAAPSPSKPIGGAAVLVGGAVSKPVVVSKAAQSAANNGAVSRGSPVAPAPSRYSIEGQELSASMNRLRALVAGGGMSGASSPAAAAPPAPAPAPVEAAPRPVATRLDSAFSAVSAAPVSSHAADLDTTLRGSLPATYGGEDSGAGYGGSSGLPPRGGGASETGRSGSARGPSQQAKRSNSVSRRVAAAKASILGAALGGEGDTGAGFTGLIASSAVLHNHVPVHAAGGAPTGRITSAEAAARDERNRMREIQKQLRLAMHKEEEERRAAEASRAAQKAGPSATTSLALAAAAYGAPLLAGTAVKGVASKPRGRSASCGRD